MSKTKKILSKEEIKERRAVKKHLHEEQERWEREFLNDELKKYCDLRLRDDNPE